MTTDTDTNNTANSETTTTNPEKEGGKTKAKPDTIYGINEIYAGTLTALSHIAHGGEVAGNVMTLHSQKMIIMGRPQLVPFVTGNSYRGILRDAAMFFMCKILGLHDLSLPALHTLFSGGALTKTGEKGIDLAAQRDLINYVPALSLFGAAFGNSMIPSPLSVGHLWPICQETLEAGMVPEEYADHPNAVLSCYDLRDTISFSRMDDAKSPTHQRLLAPAEVKAVNLKMLEGAADNAEGKAKDPSGKEQSQQMRYSTQVFAPGTVFYNKITLLQATEMQRNALHATLVAWAFDPHIGGKSAAGLGKVKPVYERLEFQQPRPSGEGLVLSEEAGSVGEYISFLKRHRETITTIIGGIK